MNRKQSTCSICYLSPKTNQKLRKIIKKLVIIFQNALSKSEISLISEDKNAKQNFFFRLVQYLMLDAEQCQQNSRLDNCQKHQKLKQMIALHLKVNEQDLEQISERFLTKIMKGKFELSILLHMSKNISRSQVLTDNKCQVVDKREEKVAQKNEKHKKEEKQHVEKVKGEMATLDQDDGEKEVLERQRTKSGFKEVKWMQKQQKSGKESGIAWNQWVSQCQLNQLYYPQFYYYEGQ